MGSASPSVGVLKNRSTKAIRYTAGWDSSGAWPLAFILVFDHHTGASMLQSTQSPYLNPGRGEHSGPGVLLLGSFSGGGPPAFLVYPVCLTIMQHADVSSGACHRPVMGRCLSRRQEVYYVDHHGGAQNVRNVRQTFR